MIQFMHTVSLPNMSFVICVTTKPVCSNKSFIEAKLVKGHTGTQQRYLQLFSFGDLHSNGSVVFLQGKRAQPAVLPETCINNKYYEEVCPQDMQ